jgi:hypothetical protein
VTDPLSGRGDQSGSPEPEPFRDSGVTLAPVADVLADLLSRAARALDALYDSELDYAVGLLEDALVDYEAPR